MKLKYAKISKTRFENLTMERDSVRDKQTPSGNWKGPQYYLRILSGPYSNKSVELPFRCYNFGNRRPGVS